MAVFLVLVGGTGSILAFKPEIERAICPELFASPDAASRGLDVVELAERAERMAPEAKVEDIYLADPDRAEVGMRPRVNPRTGSPYILDFDQLLLDPRNGAELGRRKWGDLSQGRVNFIPFIYALHYELALGSFGRWALGVVAVIWTLDCFVGLYLTLPVGTSRRVRKWLAAWRVKYRARAFRLHFDIHRAGGLWLWFILLIFAWSSVAMNFRDSPYYWSVRVLFEYHPAQRQLTLLPQPNENPRIDYRTAHAIGAQLMSEVAASEHFDVGELIGLGYLPSHGVYNYFVRSSRDIRERSPRTNLYFDGNSGELRFLDLPTGRWAGNTFASWLDALHMAEVFGLPYRIFVAIFGASIATLTTTGVYIWWRKKRARTIH